MSETIGKQYGYIRVSGQDQSDEQLRAALHEFGIEERYIYTDVQAGKDFQNAEYTRLLNVMAPGDVLVINSIDHLGHTDSDILAQWQYLTYEKKAAIVVLDTPLLDTRQAKMLTGADVADIVIQLLNSLIQTERQTRRQRQAEGIAAAQESGVRMGRRPMDKPKKFGKVYDQWKWGELSGREAAAILKVSHNTFLKWAKEFASD